MSYGECFLLCWKRLFVSIYTFYQRLVSQFLYNVRSCWKETYHHCTENCDCWFCWCRLKSIVCIVWQTIVNIVCTVVQIVIVIVSIIFYIFFFVLTIVRCIFVPCPIKKPPAIGSCNDLFGNLRIEVNEDLTWYDKLLGAITTPAKETGFSNGWDEYDFWLEARGTVIHDAYSTDGLETIDIRLISLVAYNNKNYSGDVQCSWPEFGSPKYIRAEVFPQVLVFYSGIRPLAGNIVLIKGRLNWDRDGFLEIHPEHGGDLLIVT